MLTKRTFSVDYLEKSGVRVSILVQSGDGQIVNDSHWSLVVNVLNEPLLLPYVRAIESSSLLEYFGTDACTYSKMRHLYVVNSLQIGYTVYRTDQIKPFLFARIYEYRAIFAAKHLSQAYSQSVNHDCKT